MEILYNLLSSEDQAVKVLTFKSEEKQQQTTLVFNNTTLSYKIRQLHNVLIISSRSIARAAETEETTEIPLSTNRRECTQTGNEERNSSEEMKQTNKRSKEEEFLSGVGEVELRCWERRRNRGGSCRRNRS